MTEKEFLQQVFIAYQEADSKLEQMARLQSLAQSTTTVIRNTPCGNGRALSSRIEQAVAELAGQSEHLADEIKRLLKVREEVVNAVAKVTILPNASFWNIAILPFSRGRKHAMKIVLRTIYRLHERAVKKFRRCH